MTLHERLCAELLAERYGTVVREHRAVASDDDQDAAERQRAAGRRRLQAVTDELDAADRARHLRVVA